MIEPPFEYWDPADGSQITLTPAKYEEGVGTFTPQGGKPKTVAVLRVWEAVNPPRPAPLNYWDFSGARIRARLAPLLPGIISKKGSVTLVRRGTGVMTDWEVRLG
jgi:hypothetical protein